MNRSKYKGLAHRKATRPFYVWRGDRLVEDADIEVIECAQGIDEEEVCAPFLATHAMCVLSFCMSLLGHIVRRARKFILLFKKASVRFHGSQEDFVLTFQRSTVMCIDDYLQAPDYMVEEVKHKLAASNRIYTPGDIEWERVLDPLSRANYAFYAIEFQEAVAARKFDKAKESWVSDLHQSPVENKRAGPVAPCLLTHGDYFSHTAGRSFLVQEYAGLQGMPCLPQHYSEDSVLQERSRVLPVPWMSLYEAGELSESATKKIIGNAQHRAAVAHVFTYVLAKTEVLAKAKVPGDLDQVSLGDLASVVDSSSDSDDRQSFAKVLEGLSDQDTGPKSSDQGLSDSFEKN